MRQGKEPKYGKLDSNQILGGSRHEIMELLMCRKHQITNPKYQTNLNNRNSKFQTVLVIEY